MAVVIGQLDNAGQVGCDDFSGFCVLTLLIFYRGLIRRGPFLLYVVDEKFFDSQFIGIMHGSWVMKLIQ